MVERIRELMEFKGLSSSQFADTVEVPRAVISHIISGRNKPSLEVVTKILMAFNDVSLEWMLLGEGDMLKPLAPAIAPEINPVSNHKAAQNDAMQAGAVKEENGKIQNEKPPGLQHIPDATDAKTIEQIVIFYSDKSFTAYKP